MRRTTPARAWEDPTRHSMRSTGFYEHGDGETPRMGISSLPPVRPPEGVAPDSLHMLLPPNDNPAVIFQWLALPQAWAPVGTRPGHRLAFRPDYLGSHGWRYGGPAPPEQVPPPEAAVVG